MTLYEKLKEEHRIKLEAEVASHPYTYGKVKADLLNNQYVFEIMYDTFSNLNSMDLRTYFDSAYEFFKEDMI